MLRTLTPALCAACLLFLAPAAPAGIISGSLDGVITSGGDEFLGPNGIVTTDLTGHAATVSYYFNNTDPFFTDGYISITDNVTGITAFSGTDHDDPAVGSYTDSKPGQGADKIDLSTFFTSHHADGRGSFTLSDPSGTYFETGKLRVGGAADAFVSSSHSNGGFAELTIMTVHVNGVPEPGGLALALSGIGVALGWAALAWLRGGA